MNFELNESRVLNVAQICPVTRALGPGKRFVVWVQGCPFSCRGCISPDWIPLRPANQVKASYLAEYVIRQAEIEDLEGLTISGGEPMLQAPALVEFIDCVRSSLPSFSVISFTGYTLDYLRQKSEAEGDIANLLARLDVLIDGLYVEAQNDAKGLRGSRNQQVHFLTNRYKSLSQTFYNSARNVEFHLLNGEMLLVGVPSLKALSDFNQILNRINQVI